MKFCDGFEMRLASPLGGIQQAGAPETTAKSVRPTCFYAFICGSWLQVVNFHAEFKRQPKVIIIWFTCT